MSYAIINGKVVGNDVILPSAKSTTYDNELSGLSVSNAQDAIDIVNTKTNKATTAIGKTDISTIGDGTITGAVSYLDTNLTELSNSIPYVDVTNILATITALNTEYTATEDCVLSGATDCYSNSIGILYVDSVAVNSYYSASSQIAFPIHWNLKKGQTVKFASSQGTIAVNCKVYGLLKS